MLNLIESFLKKIEQKEISKNKNVGQQIIFYYFLKNRHSTIETNKELDSLKITGISLKGNTLTIKTCRPGYLIGKEGQNIRALTTYISNNLKKKIKIKIVEDLIMGSFYVIDL
jgi:ribosomal protein S3